MHNKAGRPCARGVSRLVAADFRGTIYGYFSGSLTFSVLSNSTFWVASATFSNRRMYTFCTISRVFGSIKMGPRGLSQLIPLAAAINESPRALRPGFFLKHTDI